MVRTIHFLHIGKTAGTQIKHLVSQINENGEDCRIEAYGHHVILANLPPACDYFFSIRQPETRFRSAFYSRKRKGRPRLNVEWSPNEKHVFSSFEHANDLAEALFEETERGFLAFCAMKASVHFLQQYDWFSRQGFFFKVHPPLAILRQERLGEDVANLSSVLGLKTPLSLTGDHVLSHRNDYDGIPDLSEKARQNLRRWYIQDYLFYDYCSDWIARNRTGESSPS